MELVEILSVGLVGGGWWLAGEEKGGSSKCSCIVHQILKSQRGRIGTGRVGSGSGMLVHYQVKRCGRGSGRLSIAN